MIDQKIVDRCREKLIDVARTRTTISYGDLAKILHVASQSVGRYLNPIYDQEMAAGRPDLTVVVVYVDTGMGRYNSRGGPAQSVRVDPNNGHHVKAYKDELNRVYMQWSK
jgi:hypothetical protein